MKKMSVLLASLMVAACTSTPKMNTSQAPQSAEQKVPTAISSGADTVKATTSPAAIKAGLDLNKLAAEIKQLQVLSDYFDYDKYIVKPEYESVIQKEAAFIKTHPNDFVTLEGNADERGSDQYNLVLGANRAEAVQNSLVKYGVSSHQIKVVSLGKGKPRLTCHAEKCWEENRRVDFTHNLS